METHLYIQNMQNSRTVYEPVTEGSITWESARRGQPGKCSFTVIPDKTLEIEEGNAVRMDVDGVTVFFGFIFERSWNSDRIMKVTAYDQIRYLKNKDSYNYENKTASEVIRMIAEDFNLQVGNLADTGYVIESRNMMDKTLLDIILDALDLTMIYSGNMFVLYDNAGKLELKNIADMKLSLTLDDETAQDYDYRISIDQNTYNQIKLYRDNQQTGTRDVFMTKHTENINRWGVLQMSESLDEGVDGQAAAERYLALYNSPTSSLSIKGAFGDTGVRAGCLVPVFLDIQEQQLKNYLLIESVTHTIDVGNHTMDLTLRGAGISG